MNPTPSPRWFCRRLRALFYGVAVVAAVATGTAGLMIEQPRGGLYRYTTPYADGYRVSFDLLEDTRLQAITFWMWGTGESEVVLFGPLPIAADDYRALEFRTQFSVINPPRPPAGERSPAAVWQGVHDLGWDVPAGSYELSFFGGMMPYALPSQPFVTLPLPTGFERYADGEWSGTMAIGIRIYGVPLSTVPESATYGLMGAASLLLVGFFRRRNRAAKI